LAALVPLALKVGLVATALRVFPSRNLLP
jgi:hypothetical protein